MNRQFERNLQTSLVVLDFLILNILYLVIKIFFSDSIKNETLYIYLEYLAVSNFSWLFLSFVLRTYSNKVIMSFEIFTKRTIQVYIIWVVSILFYLYFSRDIIISRLYILVTVTLFGAGLITDRFLYLGIKNYFKTRDYLQKKVIILGYNDISKKLAKYFEENSLNTQVIGYVENQNNIHELSNYPVLGNVDETLNVAKEFGVQEIFSTITPEEDKSIYSLMYQAEKECIRFKIVPNLSIFITSEVHIDYFGDLPVLSLRSEPLDDVGNRIKKRALDLTVSLFVIIFFLSWLLPIIGLLIFIESGFPIFFKQLRTGKNKKPFYCLKFRSMKNNKEADLRQATKNDSRVTKIGKFLRKTSLDEIPQFLNVFVGEMSLVGPRPHMLKHTADYSKVVDDYMIRQFIKPGITGWAQINGYRGEITNPEQIKMRVAKDLWYLENWTFWLDIQILFLTGYYIIKGDKNAF